MSTIKDVAKLAGVSVSTVSLVLNGSQSLKVETRFRVQNAAKKLNYIPNQNARALITKHKGIIGVIRNGLDINRQADKQLYDYDVIPDTFLSNMLDYIVSEIRSADYSVLLDWVSWQDDIPPSLWQMPSILNENRIDGLLWASGCMIPEAIKKLKRFCFPVCLIGARANEYDWVDTDPGTGIAKAVKYLNDLGHQHIAFINTPSFSQTSERKEKGFLQAMEDLKLMVCRDWMQVSPFTGQGGNDAMERIHHQSVQDHMPTAVVTSCDAIACGALRYLYNHGIYCPGDISVIGYEDGLLAEYSIPPLTTVCIDKRELGSKASQVLMHRIRNPKSPHVSFITEPHLKYRASAKPPSR